MGPSCEDDLRRRTTTNLTEIGLSRCTRFGEIYYCCCLSHLPQLACSIHATWCIDLSRSLYIWDKIYLTCLNKPSKIQSLWHCDLPCAIKVGWDQVKPRFRCSRCCGLPPRSKALSMWEKKGEVSPRREKGRFIFQLSPQHGQPDMTSYSDWGGSLSWTGDEKLKKTHAFWKLLLLSF